MIYASVVATSAGTPAAPPHNKIVFVVGSTNAGTAFPLVLSYNVEHHSSLVNPNALAGIGFAAVP
jgi:hypothetical protein